MEHSQFGMEVKVEMNQLRSSFVPCRAHRSQIEKRAVREGSGSSLPGYTKTPHTTEHSPLQQRSW